MGRTQDIPVFEGAFIPNVRMAERIVLAIGLLLLGYWGVAQLHHALASQAAIDRFRAAEKNPPGEILSRAVDPSLGSKVDVHLCSKNRMTAYEASLSQKKEMPIAILHIPKINLEAPVFDDTEELTLNRGLGRIEGTAQIGQPGNMGIAGHRDGFFRGLKDINLGDLIVLEAQKTTRRFVIRQMQVVAPEDVQVLRPTAEPTLTLVTCFPFYYVGSAPQRFVVTASIQEFWLTGVESTGLSSSTGKEH